MTVHDESLGESAVVRLRAALASTSRQALLDDPHLERLVAALAAEGGDRAELAFVAACLLANDATNPKDAPRLRTWHSALRTLLALDPPAVGLRLPRGERATEGTEFREIVLRGPAAPVGGQQGDREVSGVPAAEHLRLVRTDGLLLGSPATDFGRGKIVLPRRLAFHDQFAVRKAFEGSPFHRAPNARVGDPWRVTPVRLTDDFWCEVDRHLALAWLGLRRAVGRPGALTLHDGAGILEMGGGLAAEVSAYEVPRCSRADPCEADLLVPLSAIAFGRSSGDRLLKGDAVLGSVSTSSAETDGHVTAMLAQVPHALFLAFDDVRIVVRFRANPWDASLPVTINPLPAAAAAGIERRDDESYDDD